MRVEGVGNSGVPPGPGSLVSCSAQCGALVRSLYYCHLPSSLRRPLKGKQTLLIELVVKLNVRVIVGDSQVSSSGTVRSPIKSWNYCSKLIPSDLKVKLSLISLTE